MVGRKIISGCHFAMGVYYTQQNNVFYGESKGWPMPQSVLRDFNQLISEIFGKRASQTTVYSTCHVAKQDELFHTCVREFWKNYPLQVCSHIRGISAIMSMCMAASSDAAFFSLTRAPDHGIQGFEYLRHVSSYNDFLCLVVFQWPLNQKRDISMLRCAETIHKSDNLVQGDTSTPIATPTQASSRDNASNTSSNETEKERPEETSDRCTPCHPFAHNVSNSLLGSKNSSFCRFIDSCESNGGRKCTLSYKHFHCKLCPPVEEFSVLVPYQSAHSGNSCEPYQNLQI